MKITSKLLLASLITTFSYSETIMCFLENHNDLSSLETTVLAGSSCENKSLTELKKDGWSVDDIKINNNNYIYILKKGIVQSEFTTNIDQAELEKKVLAKLEKKQKEEKLAKELENKIKAADEGKNLYVTKCQSCHGEKGMKEPSFSRKIATLTQEEFQNTLQNYKNRTYDRGSALQMKPFAYSISNSEIPNVYQYLQSIK